MKKIFLGAILVLFIAVGGGIYFLLSSLDDIVKSAIETYGSEAAQTAVRVDSVKIGLRDGTGAIYGLTVGNPSGFALPQVFSLGEISVQIDLDSLSENVFVIEQMTVRAPEVFFELDQAGKTNLDVLKQKISSGGSGSAVSSSSSQDGSAETKIIIRKLLFTDGNIHAKVVPLNKDYELKLPRIAMTNLGGNSGATPSQIADQVLKVLTDRAITEIKKQGIDQYKAQLEGEVNKRIDAETQKLKKKVGEEVGGQVENVLKGLLNN